MKKKIKNPVIIRLLLFFCLSLIPSIAQAQVPVGLAPVSHQQFFAANGAPLAGGLVYTYIAGTSTPQATYLDANGLFQNSNPIVLDAGGFATIYITSSFYKFCIANSSNVQQWCQDNISTIIQPFTTLAFNGGGAFLATFTQANTANRTYALPDFSGTVALLELGQTWPGTQRFQGLIFTGGGAHDGVLTHTNTATRTYTFPDFSGNVCISNSCSLTSPTLTDGTFTNPTITNPTITGGTFSAPALTSPTVAGNLSLGFNTGCLSGTQFQSGLLTCYNGQSTVNNGIETEVGQVALLAQTVSIAPTNIFPTVAVGGGTFLVEYDIFCETSTAGAAGTVTVTLTWPKVLATQTSTTASVDLTVLGKYIQVPLFVVANNQTLSPISVQYSTTFTGTTTAAYNLYIIAKRF